MDLAGNQSAPMAGPARRLAHGPTCGEARSDSTLFLSYSSFACAQPVGGDALRVNRQRQARRRLSASVRSG